MHGVGRIPGNIVGALLCGALLLFWQAACDGYRAPATLDASDAQDSSGCGPMPADYRSVECGYAQTMCGNSVDWGECFSCYIDDGGRCYSYGGHCCVLDEDVRDDLDAVDGSDADVAQDAAVEVEGDTATPPAPSEVWMAPNIGSEDLLALFTVPEAWPRARSRVDVFQLYAQNVIIDDAAACAPCGPNLSGALLGAGVYSTLASWNMPLSVELGSVKHWGCTAAETVPVALSVIETVSAGGGAVTYLSMDEPYIGGEADVGGQSCGFTMEQSAAQVVAFVALVQAAHPEVAVGDIEPYPYFSAAELEAWLAELVLRGYTPAFFHLDVDRNFVRVLGADVEGDVAQLRDFCRAQGIPFGVIYWGMEIGAPSDPDLWDKHFYDNAMGWFGTVQHAIGAPDHAIFQSWYASPAGNSVPRNLPEDDPTRFTLTRLVSDALDPS